MTGIFISYRQADAKAWAISLRDDLAAVFGDEQVFLDKDALQAGNWREQIRHRLLASRVVLVVIGPRWLTIADERNRPRIQLSDDVHRQEIALALSRPNLTVIPVLVDEARMPEAAKLPSDLLELANQQARRIGDTQARRKADLAVLVNDIQSVGGVSPRLAAHRTEQLGSAGTADQTKWPRIDMATLVFAFALTMLAGVYSYMANVALGPSELIFVLLVSYAVVFAVRWQWARIKRSGRGRQ